MGEHDAMNAARVDSQFVPGPLPACAQLGPVEAGVEDRPPVTGAITEQVAVDVVEGEGQRLAQLVDIFGDLAEGVLCGRLGGGGCTGHDLRALVDK